MTERINIPTLREIVGEDGAIEFVEVDLLKEREGLLASDFSIQSKLDAGAWDLLKPTAKLSHSAMDDIDNITSDIGNIDAILKDSLVQEAKSIDADEPFE